MASAAIIGGATLIGSKLSADAQKKAAKKQANAVDDAARISAEQAAQARKDALALYGPAFGDLSKGFDDAREALLAGRTSIADLLSETTRNAASHLQTGAQRYQNALLGRPNTPTPQERAAQPPGTPGKGRPDYERDIQPPAAKTSALQNAISAGGSRKLAPLQQQMSQQTGMTATDTGLTPGPDPLAPPTTGLPGATQPGATPVSEQAPAFGGRLGELFNDPRLGGESPRDWFLPPGQRFDTPSQDPLAPPAQPGTGLPPATGETETTPAPNPLLDPIADPTTPISDIGGLPYEGIGDVNLPAPVGADIGLGGFERAILEGVGTARGDLTGGLEAGLGYMEEQLGRGIGAIGRQLGAGVGRVEQGLKTGRGDITTGRDRAVSRFDPYAEGGEKAYQRELALTGALGSEAQQQAFDEYSASPGQQWLRDQQEKALMRNAAATGGLGSGQVLQELQEQAAGLASQQYQTDLANLRNLAGRGQQAAGSQAGYEFGAGQALAGLEQAAASDILRGRLQAGAQMGNLYGQAGQAGLGANLTTGSRLADLAANAGGAIGQARLGVGQQIGASEQNLANQLAQLETGLGQNLAGQEANFWNNLANLATQQGGSTADLRTNLAALLGNIATGQGTQQANLALQRGSAEAAGVTNPWGNAINTGLGLWAGMGAPGFGGGGTAGGTGSIGIV